MEDDKIPNQTAGNQRLEKKFAKVFTSSKGGKSVFCAFDGRFPSDAAMENFDSTAGEIILKSTFLGDENEECGEG